MQGKIVYRKKIGIKQADHDPISIKLREVRDFIFKRRFAEALEKLNELAASEQRPFRLGQILYLSGDVSARQGKFEEAVGIYEKSVEVMGSHARGWVRPAVEQVRCLLKQFKNEEALERGKAILNRSIVQKQNFHQWINEIDQQLKQQEKVEVIERPYRVSVVASRLGHLFLDQNQTEAANFFFNAALKENADGATRAREGLAKLALREGKFHEAIQFAKEALKKGHYRAKTLTSWSVLAEAVVKSGQEKSLEKEVKALAQAQPAVRARAILVICRTLRSCGSKNWETIATGWLNNEGPSEPIVAAELRKLFLREVKALPGESKKQASEALLQTPLLSPMEWLAGMKVLLASALESHQEPPITTWLAESAQRYEGNKILFQHRHGLAKVCYEKNRLNLARQLFQANTNEASEKEGKYLGRSLVALARLESAQENFAAATLLYQKLFQTAKSERWRIYGLMEYARALVQAGDKQGIRLVKPQLETVLKQIQDFELCLDLARMLMFKGPGDLSELAIQFYSRGVELAKQSLASATDPERISNIWLKLAQRQTDFNRPQEVVGDWQKISQRDKERLANDGGATFWEYLSLVLESFRAVDQLKTAQNLAIHYLNDVATPSLGKMILGAWLGVQLIQHGRAREGLLRLQKVVEEKSLHPTRGVAYYWLAIAAWRRNNRKEAIYNAQAVLRCLGENPGLSSQKRTVQHAKGLLFKLKAIAKEPQVEEGIYQQLEKDAQKF